VSLLTGKVVVNFHPELRVLIAEAHYLDRKGFSIPPLALQVALQQGEYRAWTENLERLLQLYYLVGHASSTVLQVQKFKVSWTSPAAAPLQWYEGITASTANNDSNIDVPVL
jgi:hypothetical protein